MSIDALPVLDRTSLSFKTDADNFFGTQLPLFSTQAEAARVEMNSNTLAAAASATAAAGAATAAGAVVWTNIAYSAGAVRYSPIDGQTYRRLNAGTLNTDPSLDGTNWIRVNLTPQSGGGTVVSSAVSLTLTSASARVQAVSMTAQLLSVTLPAANTLAAGGPMFIVSNTGTYSFTVRDASSGLLTNLAPSQCAAFYLTDNSTSAGLWAVGNHSVVSSLYPGVLTTINATGTLTALTIVALSTTQAIVVYSVGNLKARTLNITGSTFTMGAEVVLEAVNPGTSFTLCMMTSTQAIMAYVSVSGGTARAVILNVATTTITAGTVLTLAATGFVAGATVTALTSTTALMAYYQSTGQLIHCMHLTMDTSTTLSAGAESTGVSGASTGLPQIVTLSSTLCLIGWASGSATKVATVTVSGTTATINSTTTLTPPSNSGGLGLVALSSTSAVVTSGYSSPYNVSLHLLAISGTSVSVSSTTQISGDPTNYIGYGYYLSKVSSTQVVMFLMSAIAATPHQVMLFTLLNGVFIESARKTLQSPVSVLASACPKLVALSPTQHLFIYSGVSGYPVGSTLEIAL